jgi:hypothetical protein
MFIIVRLLVGSLHLCAGGTPAHVGRVMVQNYPPTTWLLAQPGRELSHLCSDGVSQRADCSDLLGSLERPALPDQVGLSCT